MITEFKSWHDWGHSVGHSSAALLLSGRDQASRRFLVRPHVGWLRPDASGGAGLPCGVLLVGPAEPGALADCAK